MSEIKSSVKWVIAKHYTNINQPNKVVSIDNKRVKSYDIIKNKRLTAIKDKTYKAVSNNFTLFFIFYFIDVFVISSVFLLKGYFINKNSYLRGARIVSIRMLNNITKKYNRKQRSIQKRLNKNFFVKLFSKSTSDTPNIIINTYKIANAIYPIGTETLHTIITGASGTGKTVLITDLIQQIRKNGDRAIIYDRMGAFVSKFYNEEIIDDKIDRTIKDDNILPNRKQELIDMFELERDTILNPLDERSPYWSVFNEARSSIDFDNIASALIPEGASNIDPFWNSAARILFSSVANKLKEIGKTSNKDLIDKLLTINLMEAAQLVKGTPAQAIIDENNPKTALSVMAMISTNLRALTTLRDTENNKEIPL
jgi:hypothetical protein